MKAIVVHQYGDSTKLEMSDVPIPSIESNDVLVRLTYAGVNFVDIYERKGLYPTCLPFVPGKEGVGVIIDKGYNVQNLSIGDRIGFAYVDCGGYAEYIAVPADQVVAIPSKIDDATASACLLQGLTAHFLTHDTFTLKPTHTALIHAAAGGVGSLAVQFAKLQGATVIGTASSEEKAIRAKELGADLVIRYDQVDFARIVMDWTNGSGVDVVYDSVGVSTWEHNLRVLKNRGLLVLYGQSSGIIPPLDVNKQLGRRAEERGSFYITRPVIRHYITNRDALTNRAKELFEYIADSRVRLLIGGQYPLEKSRKAHEDLESRQVLGKLILKMN